MRLSGGNDAQIYFVLSQSVSEIAMFYFSLETVETPPEPPEVALGSRCLVLCTSRPHGGDFSSKEPFIFNISPTTNLAAVSFETVDPFHCIAVLVWVGLN